MRDPEALMALMESMDDTDTDTDGGAEDDGDTASSASSGSSGSSAAALDPSRLFARLMHYYPALDDRALLAMPWRRVLALAREMAIERQEQREAEDAEAARIRDEIRDGRRGAGSGYGDDRGTGMVTTGAWDEMYAAAHPDEDEAPASTTKMKRGGTIGSGVALDKPVAWQWDD